MICTKCGAKMESSDAFCPSCGNPCEKLIMPDETPVIVTSGVVSTKVKKKHFPIKIVGIVSILLLVAGFFGYLALFTNFFVSDEKLIRERLDMFVAAINEGDVEKIESCLDKAQQGAVDSFSEEGKEILEGILNFGDVIEKIPGVNIPPDEKYTVKVDEITNISIDGDTAAVTADVKIKIAILPEKNVTAKVKLTKEKEGAFTHNWYISDLDLEENEEGEGVEL